MKKKIFYVCEECGLKYEDKEREQKVSEDHDKWWSWYCKNRVPNKALIKDNLRNAARTGFVVAKMVEKNGN